MEKINANEYYFTRGKEVGEQDKVRRIDNWREICKVTTGNIPERRTAWEAGFFSVKK